MKSSLASRLSQFLLDTPSSEEKHAYLKRKEAKQQTLIKQGAIFCFVFLAVNLLQARISSDLNLLHFSAGVALVTLTSATFLLASAKGSDLQTKRYLLCLTMLASKIQVAFTQPANHIVENIYSYLMLFNCFSGFLFLFNPYKLVSLLWFNLIVLAFTKGINAISLIFAVLLAFIAEYCCLVYEYKLKQELDEVSKLQSEAKFYSSLLDSSCSPKITFCNGKLHYTNMSFKNLFGNGEITFSSISDFHDYLEHKYTFSDSIGNQQILQNQSESFLLWRSEHSAKTDLFETFTVSPIIDKMTEFSAKRAAKLTDQLTSKISHEFTAPLICLSSLRLDSDASQNLIDYLQILVRETVCIANFNHFEAELNQFQIELFSLIEKVQNISSTLASTTVSHSDVQLKWNIQGRPDIKAVFVYSNEMLLQIFFLNIIKMLAETEESTFELSVSFTENRVQLELPLSGSFSLEELSSESYSTDLSRQLIKKIDKRLKMFLVCSEINSTQSLRFSLPFSHSTSIRREGVSKKSLFNVGIKEVSSGESSSEEDLVSSRLLVQSLELDLDPVESSEKPSAMETSKTEQWEGALYLFDKSFDSAEDSVSLENNRTTRTFKVQRELDEDMLKLSRKSSNTQLASKNIKNICKTLLKPHNKLCLRSKSSKEVTANLREPEQKEMMLPVKRSMSNNQELAMLFKQKREESFSLTEFVPRDKDIILIVDDVPLIRNTMKNMICSVALSLGKTIHVEVLDDGVALLNFLRHAKRCSFVGKIKAIISDEYMGFMNGTDTFDVYKKLLQQGRINSIPYVFFTAFQDQTNISKICSLFPYKVLNKPAERSEVRDLLKELI